MSLCTLLTSVCSSYYYVLIGVLVIVASRWLFQPNYRRAATRPSRDALARKHPRGTGAKIECVAPGTGELLGSVNAYTAADVKHAYEAARAAAKGPNGWSATSFEERRAVLQEVMDWIVANQQEIIELSVRDSGKTGQQEQQHTKQRTDEAVNRL